MTHSLTLSTEAQQHPHGSNRGVLTAKSLLADYADKLRHSTDDDGPALVALDWVEYTVWGLEPPEVMEMLGEGWIQQEHGMLGYRKQWMAGAVRVLADGTAGMGVHVIIPGSGCRELLDTGRVKEWPRFLERLLSYSMQFTRLDVACDDRDGILSIQRVRDAIENEAIVTRYRKWEMQQSGTFKRDSEVPDGHSIYLGTAKSSTRIRVYDKAAEQGLGEEEGPWIRLELQARDEKAMALATLIVLDDMPAISQVINGLVTFKEAGEHSQHERWRMAEWWRLFINTVEKAKLYVQKAERSVETVYNWLLQSTSASIALLLRAYDGDLDMVYNLIEAGKTRLRPSHLALLQGWKNPIKEFFQHERDRDRLSSLAYDI